MYRPNKIMKSGTLGRPRLPAGRSAYDTNGRTAVIDMSAPTPAWRETAPMAHGRAYHNMTLLPDGTVLASGGSSRSDGVDLDEVGAAGRDLEPGHGDVDDGRLAPERALSTTRRRCCCRTDAC